MIKKIKAWLFGIRTGNWSCFCKHCGFEQIELIGCVNINCPDKKRLKGKK